jgi:hypothetical protein
LKTQFRQGGSADYSLALDSALYQEKPLGIRSSQFTVTVEDSPADLEAWLKSRMFERYSVRLVAGFAGNGRLRIPTVRSCRTFRLGPGNVRGIEKRIANGHTRLRLIPTMTGPYVRAVSSAKWAAYFLHKGLNSISLV